MAFDDSLYTPSKWGQVYHSLPDWEALGAGAAGPGKSVVLLNDPMPQIIVEHQRCADPKHPHHQPWGMSKGGALHLRRTRPMLEETIKRAHRMFPRLDPNVHWSEQKYTYTFSSGYTYQFGHCKDPTDYIIYQGNEFTHIGYDELVQFDEEQYDQINLRLRCSDPVLRRMLKIRAMSNPLLQRSNADSFSVKNPNWVRDRFVKPAPQGRVRFNKKIRREDGSVEIRSFIYLPATLYDNPDPEFVRQYEITLRDKPPHIVQAMLYGNWFVTPGSFYGGAWNDKIHTCEPFKVPRDWRRFRSMDWGFKAPGCVHWWALDHDDTLYCEREYTFQEKTDAEVAKRIREIETDMKLWKGHQSAITGPADTQLWEERGESSRSKAAVMASLGVNWVRADKKSRRHNSERLMKRLLDHQHGTKPPGIVFFRTCKQAITTIPAIQTDPKDTEVPEDGGDDHWLDSVLYATAHASHGKKGIARHALDDDFEDEDDEKEEKRTRGNYGYGGY
jgi:hypothetical protein